MQDDSRYVLLTSCQEAGGPTADPGTPMTQRHRSSTVSYSAASCLQARYLCVPPCGSWRTCLPTGRRARYLQAACRTAFAGSHSRSGCLLGSLQLRACLPNGPHAVKDQRMPAEHLSFVTGRVHALCRSQQCRHSTKNIQQQHEPFKPSRLLLRDMHACRRNNAHRLMISGHLLTLHSRCSRTPGRCTAAAETGPCRRHRLQSAMSGQRLLPHKRIQSRAYCPSRASAIDDH